MTRLEELKNKREEIYRIARKHNAKRVFVFGSVARGEDRPGSDIDLLVDLTQNISYKARIQFQQELEDIFKAPIDLVPAKELHPLIRRNVLEAMIAL